MVSLHASQVIHAVITSYSIHYTKLYDLPLGRGDLPTVLVELGYLTNPDDLAQLRDAAGQEKLAGALYAGLKDFADTLKEVPR